MSLYFYHRKLILLFLFLGHFFISVGQNKIDLIEKKWVEADANIESGCMEEAFAIAKEMEVLIENKTHVDYAKVAKLKGEYWYSKEQWTKALSFFKRTIFLLERNEIDTTYQVILADTYLVTGFCFYELLAHDEAFFYYKKSLKLTKKVYGEYHIDVSDIYFNLGAIENIRKNLLKADNFFFKGLTIVEKTHGIDSRYSADFYEELGYNAMTKYDYTSAVNYLERALRIKIEVLGDNHIETFYAYHYLGDLYKDLENYEKAINYYNKGLHILNGEAEKDRYYEALLHFNIGNCLINLGEKNTAFYYLDTAVLIDNQRNLFFLLESYRLKGVLSTKNGDLDTAWDYFQQAADICQKNYRKNFDSTFRTYQSIVEHFLFKKEFENALFYLAILTKIVATRLSDTNNIELFNLHLYKGICYYQLNNPKRALFHFAEAKKINGSFPQWSGANLMQLKNKATLNLAYADFYSYQQTQNNQLSLYKKTDSLLFKTVDLISYITHHYEERSMKENFLKIYYEVYRKAIKTKFLLFEETKTKKYLEEAFIISERSKNLIFLETLNKAQIFEQSDIPKSILEEKNKIKGNITYLENKRFEENQQLPKKTSLIDQLNNNIFNLKRQYEDLLKEVEFSYPAYSSSKMRPNPISVRDAQQKLLTEEETLVEFFIGNQTIYVFLIKKDDFKAFSLSNVNNLTQKIDTFRKSIYSYRPSFRSTKESIYNDSLANISNNLGFELYNILLYPFQEQLTRKVTIIADGALGYLPFDALITKEVKQFKKPIYLMEGHLISYAHSVNWLSELYDLGRHKFDQNFVGIAPSFQEITTTENIADFRVGLGLLKHNKEEVENIKVDIGGKIITGEVATKKEFLEHLQKGQVLHLATHGKSNDKQGDFSYLAFAEPTDTIDHQFLYVKDLFNLKIPADLVVLSACETGLGEIKRGEGIVGIGKGFSYAGAKSMVTTLWRVSDNSTANFMPLFYKNLKVGQSKDEALWNAKKQFIGSYRNASHPFFWSGYVAYGNMDAIEFQHYNWSSSLIIGFILIVIIILFLLRRFFRKEKVV